MSKPEDVYRNDPESFGFDTEFFNLLKNDDKEKFIGRMHFFKFRTCPPGLFYSMITSRSINCITSVVDGQARVTFDLNAPVLHGGYPLHYVSADMQYDLVDLFLRHGARTDKRTISGENTRGGLLPLNVALEMLKYHYYLSRWDQEKSILNLICKLCLPQMELPLRVCQLLAQTTEGIDEIFKQYCIGGRIVEAATLLMVARKKCLHTTNKNLSIDKCLIGEMEWLTDADIKLMPVSMNSKLLSACKTRKTVVCHVLAMLEIFEKAGDALETYVQTERHMSKEKVINDFKMLLKEEGINLVDKDTDLSDINPESNPGVDDAKELRSKNVMGLYFPNTPYPVMYPKNHMFHYHPNSPFGNHRSELVRHHGIREKSRFVDLLFREVEAHGDPEVWKKREVVDRLNREATACGYRPKFEPYHSFSKRGYASLACVMKKGVRFA